MDDLREDLEKAFEDDTGNDDGQSNVEANASVEGGNDETQIVEDNTTVEGVEQTEESQPPAQVETQQEEVKENANKKTPKLKISSVSLITAL